MKTGEKHHVTCKMLWLSLEDEWEKWDVEYRETTMAIQLPQRQHSNIFHKSLVIDKVMKEGRLHLRLLHCVSVSR